jgi:hypothetical protein
MIMYLYNSYSNHVGRGTREAAGLFYGNTCYKNGINNPHSWFHMLFSVNIIIIIIIIIITQNIEFFYSIYETVLKLC